MFSYVSLPPVWLDDCLLPFSVEVLAVKLTDESLLALFLLSTLLDLCETLSAFVAWAFYSWIAISLLALRSSFGRKPLASAMPAAYIALQQTRQDSLPQVKLG